jgi:hypothetical protein
MRAIRGAFFRYIRRCSSSHRLMQSRAMSFSKTILGSIIVIGSVVCCDPTHSLCATATDCCDGSRLEGVQINEFHKGNELPLAKTKRDGRLCIANIGDEPPPRVKLSYQKPGFCKKVVEFANPEADLPAVCLERCPASDLDSGVKACPVASDGGGVEGGVEGD